MVAAVAVMASMGMVALGGLAATAGEAHAAGLGSGAVAGERSCMAAGATQGWQGRQGWQAARGSVAATGAMVRLSREVGPPGTMVRVEGSDWPSGAAVSVDLLGQQMDGQWFVGVKEIARATAGTDGSFATGEFAAPFQHSCVGRGYGDPNSEVRLVAHVADGSVEAEARFRYVLAPVLQVSGMGGQSAPAGAPLALSGAHWEPGATVTLDAAVLPDSDTASQRANALTITPDPRYRMQVTADAQGYFEARSQVPRDLAPRMGYMIVATGSGPLYGTVSAQGIEVIVVPATMPTLTLDRSEGTAGSSVRMTGAGWVPGDRVELEYCREGAEVSATARRCMPDVSQGLGETTVGSDGRFAATVRLPANARLGSVTMQARVAGDVFGLMVYAQTRQFTFVRTVEAVPWATQHPTLARLAALTGGGGALLMVAGAVFGGVALRRRRERRERAALSER